MTKNYRFEILTALYNNKEATIDLFPLLKSLADENMFSRLYFNILLQSMRENALISYADYGDEIKAKLLPEGIKEYQRLKKHLVAYGPKQNK